MVGDDSRFVRSGCARIRRSRALARESAVERGAEVGRGEAAPLARPAASGVPWNTRWPPSAPPSGPRSITQSACLTTSMLCSITSSVAPASSSRWKQPSSSFTSPMVQAGGGLVEDVEHARPRPPRARCAASLTRWASPPRQRGRRLPQAQVAEADLARTALSRRTTFGLAREEVQRLVHGHVQHLVDRLPAVAHLEHGRAVAPSPAGLAHQVHVGQELHVHADLAVARAGLAAAAGHVEREVAGRRGRAPRASRGGREQLADAVERLQVGHGVRARRAADRRLVHQHHLVHELDALDGVVLPHRRSQRPRRCRRAAQTTSWTSVDLPEPETPGHAGEGAQRDAHVDALRGCGRARPSRRATRPLPAPALGRHGDAAARRAGTCR